MATTWETANRLIADLQRDFGLDVGTAQGIVGALAMESRGFQELQERNPIVPGSRGGYGFAQWTGPRRVAYENFARQNNLDPTSYEANYRYLAEELRGVGNHDMGVINRLQGVTDPQAAQQIFTNVFLRPGIPHPEQRAQWTNNVVANYAPYEVTPSSATQANRVAAAEGLPVGEPDGALAAIGAAMGVPVESASQTHRLALAEGGAGLSYTDLAGLITPPTPPARPENLTRQVVPPPFLPQRPVSGPEQIPQRPTHLGGEGPAYIPERPMFDLNQMMQVALLANPAQTMTALGGETTAGKVASGAVTPAQAVALGLPTTELPPMPEVPLDWLKNLIPDTDKEAAKDVANQDTGAGASPRGSGGGSERVSQRTSSGFEPFLNTAETNAAMRGGNATSPLERVGRMVTDSLGLTTPRTSGGERLTERRVPRAGGGSSSSSSKPSSSSALSRNRSDRASDKDSARKSAQASRNSSSNAASDRSRSSSSSAKSSASKSSSSSKPSSSSKSKSSSSKPSSDRSRRDDKKSRR